MTAIRLYLVDKNTNKKTGKKRDYASLDLFYKYSDETYDRYNFLGKAELRFIKDNKWTLFSEESLKK